VLVAAEALVAAVGALNSTALRGSLACAAFTARVAASATVLLAAHSSALLELRVVVVVQAVGNLFGGSGSNRFLARGLAARYRAKESDCAALIVLLVTLGGVGNDYFLAGEVCFESNLEGFVIVLQLLLLSFLLFDCGDGGDCSRLLCLLFDRSKSSRYVAAAAAAAAACCVRSEGDYRLCVSPSWAAKMDSEQAE